MNDRKDKLDATLKGAEGLSVGQREQLAKLAQFKPTAIGLSCVKVMSMPEVNSLEPVYIVQVGKSGNGELGWFSEYGLGETPVEFRDFTGEERERLIYAQKKLKLPSLVAVHLVMNKGMNQGEMRAIYGQPGDEVQIPGLLSLGKLSMQGKTLLAVELRRRGVKVVNLDEFSEENLDSYWGLLGGNPQSLTTEEAVERILAGIGREKKEKGDWTMMKALDRLAGVFVEGNRPEAVVCDMPGYRIPVEGEEARMRNVFDLVGEGGMIMIMLGRFEGVEQQTESRIDWWVIEDYMSGIDRVWSLYVDLARSQEGLFESLMANDVGGVEWRYDLFKAQMEIARQRLGGTE